MKHIYVFRTQKLQFPKNKTFISRTGLFESYTEFSVK